MNADREIPAPSTHEAGPRASAQYGIGVGLLVIAVALWVDAAGLPPPVVGGVGPAAVPRIVGVLVAALGIAHLVSGWRLRGRLLRADRGNHRSLAWVMGALLGLIAVMQFGGGFVLGATWLFAATAHAFGERWRVRLVALGAVLSLPVFLFFTRVLSLALPSGPLERWLLG